MKRSIHSLLTGVLAISMLLTSASVPARAAFWKKKKVADTEKEQKKESEYEKLFKEKQYQTAKGFMTIHLFDDCKVLFELPKDILGRDILVSNTVEKVSNGDAINSGFTNTKAIHVRFELCDSLILMRDASCPYIAGADSPQTQALEKNFKGAILASQKIKTLSPDSTAYVFSADDLLSVLDKKLEPYDANSPGSYGGIVDLKLKKQDSKSFRIAAEGFSDNMSILAEDTYKLEQRFLGSLSSAEQFVTTLDRRNFLLLGETPARIRYADSRIGLNPIEKLTFGSGDRGSKSCWIAKRWNIGSREHLTFYMDPLINPEIAEAVRRGVLEWNNAFAGIGRPDFIEVLPFPTDDPEFSVGNLKYSCIVHESSTNSEIRSNIWTDPRTGEIVSARIYVPFDLPSALVASLMINVGLADKEVRNPSNKLTPRVLEGVSAAVTHEMGKCLGLGINAAGSSTVPLDSLRSATYTSQYGLSNSVMDIVPYNFTAREGDLEKGVALVHTKVGCYDKYAIDWLYGTIEGAATPEDEIAPLSEKIRKSLDDPRLMFHREYNYKDIRRGIDPRAFKGDLGDDGIRSARIRMENLCETMSQIDKWVAGNDDNYDFRRLLALPILEASAYNIANVFGYVGAFWFNEVEDGFPAVVPLPRELQKKAFNEGLELAGMIDGVDNRKLDNDLFFRRSIPDFVTVSYIMPSMLGCIASAEFCAEKSADPYTPQELFENICDYMLRDVKYNRPMGHLTMLMNYSLFANTRKQAGIMTPKDGEKDLYSAIENEGYETVTAIPLLSPDVSEPLMFSNLKMLQKRYRTALGQATDPTLRKQLNFLLSCVNDSLKID